MQGFKKKGGIRLTKNQSVVEALEERMPHWIHKKKEDKNYVGGFRYERRCYCSECGYEVEMEKPICPKCHIQMYKL